MGYRGAGFVGALFVVSCASYTPSVRSDAEPRPDSAYLYGRFYMNSDVGYGAIGRGKQSMGIELLCQDASGLTRSYTFGSTDTRDVQVLEIKPGRCWVMKAVLADREGRVRKTIPADPSEQRPLDLGPGTAHYLGDYFAKGDYSRQAGDAGTSTVRYWKWAMSPADDRYESTTADMKRSFPKLASLPTDDQRLILARPRKVGNGIVGSPGEPWMSPQRVAALAPYIRRDYATPALCEAACPTGQCLPYRGPSRPAIACVIRCDRDGDCPSTMACNCPNAEHPAGDDCRPVASTKQDSMSRICFSAEPGGAP